ncbi:hypothetical protein CBS101457_001599 [Exobasidium rhododendri]|nr:hypothetical protein CBS101457_001599 [Exobasidium rhododendri]
MDSFRTFGVSETTQDVIAIHIAEEISAESRQILSLISEVVEGTLKQDGLDALNYWKEGEGRAMLEGEHSPVMWDKVKKAYKLEESTDRKRVESLVTSMVAMKSVAS